MCVFSGDFWFQNENDVGHVCLVLVIRSVQVDSLCVLGSESSCKADVRWVVMLESNGNYLK